MTSLIYHVTLGTGLALSVDPGNPQPGGQLFLDESDFGEEYQAWQLLFSPWTQGSILFNPKTGLCAAPTSLDNGAPVVLFDVPGNVMVDAAHTWQVVGDGPFVLRMVANDDRNLNAQGNSWSPGTPIIVYDWGGGQPNEVWNLTMQKFG